MENPLHHFELHPLIHLTLMGFDISINKAIVAMWVGIAVVFGLFMMVVSRGCSLVPDKMQSVAEIGVDFIKGMVNEYIGKEGMKYFPFIGALFFFILTCNVVGLIPGSYTLTSQLVVTGAFSGAIFILTLIIGFAKHGLHFLGILVPPGIPKLLIPIMIPIEIISQLARPISLSVRLFANMTAGHTVLTVLFSLATATALWIGWMPFGFTVLINGLELFIAFIQAYIFATLTCVYIGDVIRLH